MIRNDISRYVFSRIDYHLLQDEKPSYNIDRICGDFTQYPFDMLYKLRLTEQSPIHHPEGNVWNHTMLVLDEAAKLRKKSSNARVYMWAALLHDIGKPPATKIRGDKVTAYDHDKIGARLAADFLSTLTDDTGFAKSVAALVRWHMQVFYVVRNLPFADIRAIKEQTDINETALLGLADRLGRPGADAAEEERNIRLFLKKCGQKEAVLR
jgi:putative nucleotidyltransferase with HDIG domain